MKNAHRTRKRRIKNAHSKIAIAKFDGSDIEREKKIDRFTFLFLAWAQKFLGLHALFRGRRALLSVIYAGIFSFFFQSRLLEITFLFFFPSRIKKSREIFITSIIAGPIFLVGGPYRSNCNLLAETSPTGLHEREIEII